MRTRALIPLAGTAVFLLACSDRMPTEPAPGGRSAFESAVLPARQVPRSLAPRVSEGIGLIGTWGADHLNLTVGAASSVVAYDCAHGTIDVPFATNAAGLFDLSGTHVPETPGPIRENDPPIAHPARYSGVTDGTTMTLTVTVPDLNLVLGPFQLTRGAAGRLVKCV